MRPWLMGIGLTLAINGLTYAVSDAFGAPLALVTPEGFCEADGSHPADAKVTALFKKSLDTMLGAKLLSLYRFCPGSPTTSGLIVVAERSTLEGSPSSFVGDACAQLRAVKEVPDMDQIVAQVDKIAREKLGRGTMLTGLKVLTAVLEGGVCYAFLQPEGSSKEPVLEILSYVPIGNKLIFVLRVYGVTAPSATAESYKHLQQTIAALQQANP